MIHNQCIKGSSMNGVTTVDGEGQGLYDNIIEALFWKAEKLGGRQKSCIKRLTSFMDEPQEEVNKRIIVSEEKFLETEMKENPLGSSLRLRTSSQWNVIHHFRVPLIPSKVRKFEIFLPFFWRDVYTYEWIFYIAVYFRSTYFGLPTNKQTNQYKLFKTALEWVNCMHK